MKNPKVQVPIAFPPRTSSEETPSSATTSLSQHDPGNETPTCERCASSAYLVYERITLVLDAERIQPPGWDLAYWCGKCESFYGMLTTVAPGDRKGIRLAAENPRYVHYAMPEPNTDTGTEAAPSLDNPEPPNSPYGVNRRVGWRS
ncbi:hypothetical protein ACIGB6_01995 [Paeniglutamicibacter gangotriensis]|uniref:Uncharacterized protein n=1 Tax=Paeniglutamicibacter gangotriensis TaxID=254787 RepID=A0A5B0E7M1_9MICC|nr:hypothetical protein [Paeniglutamicibacter gangotriensis]KAA0973409.1 hypothetical protein FQ154_18320 [Paeniglutamicibacter gangotriensis]